MIRAGLVQLNHVTLEEPDELCNNNVTISIRGIGRFTYAGSSRKTKSGRIAAEFLQEM
jgi:RNA-binding protein YlmH